MPHTYRRTLRLALPAVAENLLNSLILLVDALMVASTGTAALAAAGLSSVALWRTRAQASVFQAGLGAIAARRWGEGDQHAASTVLTHGIFLGFLLGTLFLLPVLFAGELFRALQAGPDIHYLATDYFTIIMLALPLRMASGNLSATLRAAGDTRTPMTVTLFINLVNIAFNYPLIHGVWGFPRLGLHGAAIASVISFVVEFLLLSALCYRGIRPRLYAPEGTTARGELKLSPAGARFLLPGITKRVIRISLPTFGEELAVSVGFLGYIAMIARLGSDDLAAHTSVARIESFSYMIGVGIAMAASALVGQALGAGSPHQARRSLQTSLVLSAVAMGCTGILLALFPTLWLSLFASGSGAATLLAAALPIMLITASEQPLIGVAMTLSGALRGAGYTLAPLLSQLVGTVFIRLGFGWWLGFQLGLGLEGLYLATVIDWSIRCLVLGAVVRSGRWERVVA